MACITGTWLSGPQAALPKSTDGREQSYRGEFLGFPQEGPGSLVGSGRRIAALLVDWVMAVGVASLITGDFFDGMTSTVTLMVWFAVGVVTVALFNFTPGQFVLGLQVARIEGPIRVGFVRALGRQALLVFVIPATITDIDGRGMQDRATGTLLVKSR